MRIRLPLPPSVNGMYRNTAKGRVLTDTARTYKQDAAWRIREQVLRMVVKEVPGPVAISIALVFAPKGGVRRDIDNCCKCLIDCLVAAKVIEDDVNNQLLTVHKLVVAGEAQDVGAWIDIRPITDADRFDALRELREGLRVPPLSQQPQQVSA